MSTSTGVQCAEIQEILKIFEKRLSDMVNENRHVLNFIDRNILLTVCLKEHRIIELEQQISDSSGNHQTLIESSDRQPPTWTYEKEELLNIRSTVDIQSSSKPPQMKVDYSVIEDGEITVRKERAESEKRTGYKPTETQVQDGKYSLSNLINSYKESAELRAQRKASGQSNVTKHERRNPQESTGGEVLKGKKEMIYGLVIEYPPGEEPEQGDYSVAKVT